MWFASQYEGTEAIVEGLAGVISIEQSTKSYHGGISKAGLTSIDVPVDLQMQAQHYLSSVAIAGNHVIYTAARGSVAFMVNRSTLQVEESLSIFDCSGVASTLSSNAQQASSESSAHAAIITTGTGNILRTDKQQITELAEHALHWDNHVYPI